MSKCLPGLLHQGVQSLNIPRIQATPIAISIQGVPARTCPGYKSICLAHKSSTESYLDTPLDYGSPAKLLYALISTGSPSLTMHETVRDLPTLTYPGSPRLRGALCNKCPTWYPSCLLHPGNPMPKHTLVNKVFDGFIT